MKPMTTMKAITTMKNNDNNEDKQINNAMTK